MKRTMVKRLLSIAISICMISGSILSIPISVNATKADALSLEETSTYSVSSSGNMANVVVFVNFNDTDHSEHTSYDERKCYAQGVEGAKTTFNLFNGDETHPFGMKYYLEKISYGALNVTNIFPQYDKISGNINPYELANNTKHYFDNDIGIIDEILDQMNRKGDLTENADQNGDGFIDNLTIVVPCEEGGRNREFYGHKAFYGGSKTVNGCKVGNYTLIPEEGTYLGINGTGVIIHEFLHTVGYPDLYRGSNSGNPVWLWDIMAKTHMYVQYPLAYLRSGITCWFDIPTITESKKGYSIYAASAATAATKNQQAVILKTNYSDTEFFVLEYRKKGTDNQYDYKIPGSGLIIYRVNTVYETNKTGAPDMIYVFRPGDTYDSSTKEQGTGDLYKSYLSLESGQTSYGSSDPEKSLADGAITYSDGTNSGIVISNVGSAGGDQITFDITYSDISNGEYWTLESEQGGDDTSIEIDPFMDTDGTLYCLQKKESLNGPVYLYRYDTNGWKRFSTELEGTSYNISLGKYKGNFYVGYLNQKSYEFKLARWNGSKWDIVYTSPAASNEFSMTAKEDGIYLTYTNSDNKILYAGKYTSSGMEMLGSRVCQSSYVSNLSIDAENGKVVIMYREVFNDNRLSVKSYNNASHSWLDVGNMTLKANSGIMKIHKNQIYLLKNGSGVLDENESDMYKYNLASDNGIWEKVGNNSYANENITDVDICFHGDAPHIIFQGGASRKVQVMNLLNQNWVNLGSRVTAETISGLKAFSYNGSIWVVYRSTQTGKTYIKTQRSGNTATVPDGTTGGNSGTASGGNTGGSSGSTSGGTTGGNNGTASGGNAEGSSGSTSSGTTGGNSGTTTGGNTGENNGTTSSGNAGESSGNTTGGNTGENVGNTSEGNGGNISESTNGENNGNTSGNETYNPTEPESQEPVNTSGIETLTVTMLKANTLQLYWSKVPDVLSYEVYYSTSPDTGFKRLTSTKKDNYKFTKAKCGQTYYFKVRVIKKVGKVKSYGDFCPVVSGMTILNGIPDAYVQRTSYNSVTIKWNKVKDAKKYEIYYSTSPNGGFQLLKSQGGTSFTHRKLQTGATYYYMVRAVRDSYYTEYSNITSAQTVLGSVVNLKVASTKTDQLKVTWKKVPGVDYYIILRSDRPDGVYEQIGTTNKTSYVDMGLNASTTYFYKVYAVAGPYRTNEAGPVGQTTKAPKI